MSIGDCSRYLRCRAVLRLKSRVTRGSMNNMVTLKEQLTILSAENRNSRKISNAARCRELLDGIVKPVTAVRYVVALGKRDLLWELLPDAVPPNVLEVRHGK